MSFTAPDFRATMARFATGVTVVTTTKGRACYGLTVNAFCSVSLNPPLVLVSLDLGSQTYAAIRQSGVFAVNVLTKEQEPLAMRFARKDLSSKTFEDIAMRSGETTGVPLFANALAYIECRVSKVYPGGDHMLLLGEVLSVGYGDDLLADEPLLYYRSAFWVTPQAHVPSQQQVAAQVQAAPAEHAGEQPGAAGDRSVLHPLELFPLPYVFSLES